MKFKSNNHNYLAHAETIWHFLSPDYVVTPSDFMLVLGSSDLDVPQYASSFWSQNLVDFIVITGGWGKRTKELWAISEAGKFARVMIQNGVPPDKIILEEEASNTGENMLFTKKRLAELGLAVHSGIIITKPYMRRRAYNTAVKQWPEVRWSVSTERLSFSDYLKRQEDPEQFISVMVGDLQRIKLYAEKGFQIQDKIPEEVWYSFETLAQAGFDQYLIRGIWEGENGEMGKTGEG